MAERRSSRTGSATAERTRSSSGKARTAQRYITDLFDRLRDERPTIGIENVAAMNQLGIAICNDPDRRTFLQSLLFSVFDEPSNEDRAEYAFAERLSESSGWPLKRKAIKRELLSRFIKSTKGELDYQQIISYLYVVLVCVQFKHPCVNHHLAYTNIRLSRDLEKFESYFRRDRFAATREQIVTLGDGLYKFLDYGHPTDALKLVEGSNLFSGIRDSFVKDGIGSYGLLAIRPAETRNQYMVSLASVGLVTSESSDGESSRLLFVSTATSHDTFSRGFVLCNAKGDVYFLQYQPAGLGFNITFVPMEELEMPGGFARGIILTYDTVSKLGGMATRIAVLRQIGKNPLTGTTNREDLRSAIALLGKESKVDFGEIERYLSNSGYVEILRSDRKGPPINTLGELKRYLDEKEEIDGDGIIGYASYPIRTG